MPKHGAARVVTGGKELTDGEIEARRYELPLKLGEQGVGRWRLVVRRDRARPASIF
ncbi:MAG: hypothetical protein L0Z50_07340 [Verrucomicrobiales bacterium]|nr:hypothetical protein [Verrucomicrobiales bacterium]